ncbi:MAG: hypothetical protein ACREQ7_21150 [Candidatus Binatia bacterium]
MSLQIVSEVHKVNRGQNEEQADFAPQSNGAGWPKNTWFQKRLRYVREQQRRKEIEFVYECGLGTITFRQPIGVD